MRVLVIQGAGMDQRGKVQVEVFGPETIDQINAGIEGHAASMGIEVEIAQTNDEVEAVRLLAASTADALIINPGGFTTSEGPLPDAISAFGGPAIEVHASNPAARGVRSTILPVCKAAVAGFGYDGYRLALLALSAD